MGVILFSAFIISYCFSSVLPQLVLKPVRLNESPLVPRIVNGRPAKLGDVPYQIAFKKYAGRNSYKTFCGGVIIRSNTILTAAHCFVHGSSWSSDCSGATKKVKRKDLQAYAVAGNLWNTAGHPGQRKRRPRPRMREANATRTNPMPGNSANTPRGHSDGQWRSLASGVYPNKYKFPKYDIALVWTRAPFRFNSHVSAIRIATVHIEYTPSMPCLASGYGRTSTTAKTQTTVLLLADLDVIPTSQCSRMHRKNMFHFVCTSTAVSDVAQGDSGGPLVCKNTGDRNDRGKGVVTGIVSGARVGVGSFFTRVSSFREWIQKGGAAMNGSSITCISLAIYAILF